LPGKAAKWYQSAAEQGNVQAQGNLGLMYLMGQGVPEDFVEAYAWFAVAAARGDMISRDYIDIVANNMTPAQVEKAKALAEEYSAKASK